MANWLAPHNRDAVGGFTPVSSSVPPTGASITLITADVVAAQRAAAAGARVYLVPTVKPWGQTVSYVLDPNGIFVEIGTPVAA